MKPLGQVFVPGMTNIMHLLNDSNTGWDQGKVKNMFPPAEASDILQIPVGGPTVQDYLAWNHTENGVFKVRSAYHLCMDQKRAKTGRPAQQVTKTKGKRWGVASPMGFGPFVERAAGRGAGPGLSQCAGQARGGRARSTGSGMLTPSMQERSFRSQRAGEAEDAAARLGLRRRLGREDGSGAKVVANERGDPPDLTRGDDS